MSLEELFASPADNTGGAADSAAARLKEYSALTDNADRCEGHITNVIMATRIRGNEN